MKPAGMKMKTRISHRPPPAPRGFSLVEMMLVMTIVAILLALGATGLRTTWRSQQIYTSATNFMQACSLARSTAIRHNRPIQVRIYRFQDGDLTGATPQYRAFQVVGVQPGADQDKFYAINELQKFEGTTVMSKFSEYSSIVVGDTMLGASDTYSYVAVEFRPDGTTNLETNPGAPWTVTLLNDWGSDTQSRLPKDARTMVISPDTGAVSLF